MELDTSKIIPPFIDFLTFIGNGVNIVFINNVMGCTILTADIKLFLQ